MDSPFNSMDSSSSSSRFFPHPLTGFMRSNAALKMILPFILAIMALCAYSVLDRMMPPNTTYGTLEYSFDSKTMQKHLDEFNEVQYCVVGFSVGLHLFNAVMYAATTGSASAWCSLQLRGGGFSRLATMADVICYMRLVSILMYFIQHITILSQFLLRNAGTNDAAPRLVGVIAILFLMEIAFTVLFIIATLLWVAYFKSNHGGQTPLQVQEEGQESSQNGGGGLQMMQQKQQIRPVEDV